MVVFPNAKINLGLHVVAKRPDGYHDIETVFYPVTSLTDVLEIVPAESFSFTQTGIAVDGTPETNLCVRAYNLLAADFKLPPVQMFLHKAIPTGSGLGGGSADASFVLTLLNGMFALDLDAAVLKTYASRLGSDCAFFIDNNPSMATGRGEILSPVQVNLADLYLLLVKPDVHVSTADAYAGVTPGAPSENLARVVSEPPELWKGRLVNDFETTVFKRFPSIAEIKNKMYDTGAIYASMSGSGATVFGLFDGKTDTENLCKIFNNYTFLHIGRCLPARMPAGD